MHKDNSAISAILTKENDPLTIFKSWLEEATETEINDPNAMALATVDADGMPNVRVVLLKGLENRGFTFYTNVQSTKGKELENNEKAALCFHWKSLRRQVRIRGKICPVTDEQADKYFQSRPVGSRIGAWASKQSDPLENREVLEKQVEQFTQKFENSEIPRPPHWSGYSLLPDSIEFWVDREFRLHDRMHFYIDSNKPNEWQKMRLYP